MGRCSSLWWLVGLVGWSCSTADGTPGANTGGTSGGATSATSGTSGTSTAASSGSSSASRAWVGRTVPAGMRPAVLRAAPQVAAEAPRTGRAVSGAVADCRRPPRRNGRLFGHRRGRRRRQSGFRWPGRGGAAGGAVSALPDPGTAGDGDSMVGPTYTTQADLSSKGNPKGKNFNVSVTSTIFNGKDATLNKTPVNVTRTIQVYVPAQYKDGTPAPVLSHSGWARPNRAGLQCSR